MNRGDGACIFLTNENLCAIYDWRPDHCRIDPANWGDTYLKTFCTFVREHDGLRKNYKGIEDGSFNVRDAIEACVG